MRMKIWKVSQFVFRETHEDNLEGLGFLLTDLLGIFLELSSVILHCWTPGLASPKSGAGPSIKPQQIGHYAISLSIMQDFIEVAPKDLMGELPAARVDAEGSMKPWPVPQAVSP